MNWNSDQKALIQWITSGLKIKEVRDLKGDSGYLLNNMIAKVTLACNEYTLSIGALKMFNMMKVDLKKDIKEVNSMKKNNLLFMNILYLHQ